MKITTITKNHLNKVPTRFDDIQKEIKMVKINQYFNQKPNMQIKEGTYEIGDVIGKTLNKIV